MTVNVLALFANFGSASVWLSTPFFMLGDLNRPVIIGHSWVTRLKNSNLLPDYYEFVDLPGGNLFNLVNKINLIPINQDNDYVFVFLGGNDIDNCASTKDVPDLFEHYQNFICLIRQVYPHARIVTAQVEDRFVVEEGKLQINQDFKRKSNKFNKWLNALESKDGLLPIKGVNFLSGSCWYSWDGVHLNHAGEVKLAAILRDCYDNRMAG